MRGIYPCEPKARPFERLPSGARLHALGDAAGRECETCTLRCGRERGCGHACEAPCHVGACQPCALPVVQPCHCGKSSVMLECHSLHEVCPAP